MKKIDYIVIGQGIAGTMLSWYLLNHNKKVLVVDQYNPSSSTNVAAGIYNPVTGRRFVKTWMADKIFPFAKIAYQQLEKELDSHFYHPMQVLRMISDDLEKKEFEKKYENPDYVDYLSREGNSSNDSVNINHAGYVDFPVFIQSYREMLKERKLIYESHFTFHDLSLGRDGLTWKDYAADKIIFCEGYHVLNNPFFSDLPITTSKGEILTIKSFDLPQDQLINSGIFILPVGDHLFRVGSTYDWEDRTEEPTEKAKKELVVKLAKVIGSKFEIIDQKAGIRPTVKDRNPVLGMHPEFEFVGIFNGLGTKGASLAPYFANQFVEFLEDGKRLNAQVDIKRFK